MKAYICDQCGKRDEPQAGGYDLPPKGWFTLTEPETFKYRHLCGPACLCAIAEKALDAATAPLIPPPPAPEAIDQPLIDPPIEQPESPREF
jgi:hypothetical protein